jgi:hypothetical protein
MQIKTFTRGLAVASISCLLLFGALTDISAQGRNKAKGGGKGDSKQGRGNVKAEKGPGNRMAKAEPGRGGRNSQKPQAKIDHRLPQQQWDRPVQRRAEQRYVRVDNTKAKPRIRGGRDRSYVVYPGSQVRVNWNYDAKAWNRYAKDQKKARKASDKYYRDQQKAWDRYNRKQQNEFLRLAWHPQHGHRPGARQYPRHQAPYYGDANYPGSDGYYYGDDGYYYGNDDHFYTSNSSWRDVLLRTVIGSFFGGNRAGSVNDLYNGGYYSASYLPYRTDHPHFYERQPIYTGYDHGDPYAGYYSDDPYGYDQYGSVYGDGSGISPMLVNMIGSRSNSFLSDLLGQTLATGYSQGRMDGQYAQQQGWDDQYYRDPYAYENAGYGVCSTSLAERRQLLSEGYELGYRDALTQQNTGYYQAGPDNLDLVSLLLNNVLRIGI